MTSLAPRLRFLDGDTRIIGLLGDPVRQVRAPRPLTEAMQAMGFNAVELPMHVRSEDFDMVVTALKQIGNLAGLVLTVPHKFAGLKHVDRLGPVASAAGAINALRREADGAWCGEHFDGIAFVAGLKADGQVLNGASAVVVGAGGVGCAVAAALCTEGIARLQIYDANPARARDLCSRLALNFPWLMLEPVAQPEFAAVDLAVNCTPLGMAAADPLPFDPRALPPKARVAEVVMNPAVTPLIAAAREAGLATSLGENVMTHQLGAVADFFAEMGSGP